MNIPDFSRFQDQASLLGHTALSCSYDAVIRNEITEDFILPDSLPDVKKLLKIEFSPQITDYTCEGGMLRYSGECRCEVLYVSDTNRLRSGEFICRFSGKESIEEGSDQRVLLVPRITRNDSRMLNPRKLSMRLGLEVRACVLSGHNLKCRVIGENGAEEEATMQWNEESVTSLVFTCAERIGLPFREDVELENNQPTIGEVICCHVESLPTQISVEDGKVDVSGDVLLRCLYETDTGRCFEMNKRYSIREAVEIPDARKGMSAMAHMNVCGVQVSAQNNSYGERRVLEVDAEIELTVYCFDNEQVCLLRDAYSTDYVTENKNICPAICSFEGMQGTGFSVNHSILKNDVGAEKMSSIFGGTLLPGEISLVYDEEKKKLLLDGKAVVTFLSELPREEDEYGKEYMTLRAEVPIRGEIECRDPEFKNLLLQMFISQSRFHCDESKLYVDFEVNVTTPRMKVREEECISEVAVRYDRAYDKEKGSSILLYYPEAEDTLWSVSKQYRIQSDKIAEANQLEDGSLMGKKVLLIPAK